MTNFHVNNYSLNINKTSKSGNNEKPIWNGKKPYKYLEDFNDAALAYDKKAKQYYISIKASWNKTLPFYKNIDKKGIIIGFRIFIVNMHFFL